MTNLFKSLSRFWVVGIIVLFFLVVSSYGFMAYFSTKSFSASFDYIESLGEDIKAEYNHINKPGDHKKNLEKLLTESKKDKKWIKSLNIITQNSKTGKISSLGAENIDLKREFLKLSRTMNFEIDDYDFRVFYPLESTTNVSTYLYVKGNIFFFYKLSLFSKIFNIVSFICFTFLGIYFLRQYNIIQKIFTNSRETERILAEKSRTDEITARFARSVLLSGSMDEASIYAKESAGQLVGGEYLFAGYVNENDESLDIFLSNSKYEEILGESCVKKRLSAKYGIWGKAISSGRSFYLNDADGENSRLPGRNSEYYSSSILAVPAVVRDKVVGIIVVANRKLPFTQADQKALERIASLYAVSIQKESAFATVKERENQFRVVFKTNPDSVSITSMPGGDFSADEMEILDVNDGFCIETGYEYSEVVGKTVLDINFFEDSSFIYKIVSEIEVEGKVINLETRYRLKSGEYCTGLVSASKIYINGENHILWIVREIEELKQVENELRREREFLSKVVETSPAGIIAVDGKSGETLYVNQRTSDIVGRDINEIKSIPFQEHDWDITDFDLKKLDYSNHIFNLVNEKKESLHDVKHALINGSGKRVYISYNATPVIDDKGDVEMFVASLEDVSQKILTEKSLKETEERLASVISNLPVVLWAVDVTGEIKLCRGLALKPLGIKPDSLVGESIFERYKDFPEIISVFNKGLKKKPFITTAKHRERYYEVTVSPIEDSTGAFTGISGVAIDISRRVKMEEEQRILSAAIRQAAESIVITDKNGDILYVNPAFENISGYAKEEAIGNNPNIIQSGFHERFFYEDLWNHITNGITWHGYLKNKAKDGFIFEEEASISPVVDRSGSVQNYVAVKRDVTQERKMENQLRKAQKLEAIGTLAGGIAHDFNNILFPIIGFTELLSAKTENGTESKRYLDNILSAAHRAKELVHQILTFSRQNEEEKRPIKVHIIVKEAMKLLRASIPSIIDIKQDIESTDMPVMADPTKIHQLIMNLGTNAYQSMEKNGGILGISVKCVDIEESDTENSLMSNFHPGKYIRLSVTDTGTGIPKNIVERIFDPYFTTKPQGKGTGLGLSTVHGIIQSCNGHIKVYSEENKGSSFHVYFPVVGDMKYVESDKTNSLVEGGSEHLLIVDDEEAIVEVVGDMLRDLGYKITVRTSSVEALEAFKANPDIYDCMVSDHTMPNMTGIDLTREIQKVRNDFPVVICSGFSEVVTRQKAKSVGVSNFIMKPVLKKDLAAAVRKALEGKKD